MGVIAVGRSSCGSDARDVRTPEIVQARPNQGRDEAVAE